MEIQTDVSRSLIKRNLVLRGAERVCDDIDD